MSPRSTWKPARIKVVRTTAQGLDDRSGERSQSEDQVEGLLLDVQVELFLRSPSEEALVLAEQLFISSTWSCTRCAAATSASRTCPRSDSAVRPSPPEAEQLPIELGEDDVLGSAEREDRLIVL